MLPVASSYPRVSPSSLPLPLPLPPKVASLLSLPLSLSLSISRTGSAAARRRPPPPLPPSPLPPPPLKGLGFRGTLADRTRQRRTCWLAAWVGRRHTDPGPPPTVTSPCPLHTASPRQPRWIQRIQTSHGGSNPGRGGLGPSLGGSYGFGPSHGACDDLLPAPPGTPLLTVLKYQI
jgi:hypothetical protein